MYPKPQPDVFTLQKRLPVRRKYVTIAAGFKCFDGVVLCSDTRESGDLFKRRVAKLVQMPRVWPLDKASPRALFTGSGDAAFVDEVIECMWKGVAGKQSLHEITTALQFENRNYRESIWKAYPCLYSTTSLPDADLIFAVWAEDGYGLYKMHSGMFSEVNEYVSVGCGGDLADYLCAIPDWLVQDTAKTVAMAVFMLNEVKEHVPGCGGESHIALLTANGNVQFIDPITEQSMSRNLALEKMLVSNFILESADPRTPDKQFKAKLKKHVAALLHARASYRKEINRIRRKIGRGNI
jgi:hypothetical protein